MKIGFYSPYFDNLSGGERYVLTLASHWSKEHTVTLFWDDPGIVARAQKRLGIDLSKIKTTENVFATRNVFKKLAVSRNYDLIFFLTDGSVPTTFAKRNILHFQVPFRHVPAHPIKLNRFQVIVVNSDFTKRNIDGRIGKRAVVIYPPVVPISGVTKKQNVILSVGRFHPFKKQDILIDAFHRGKFTGYRLILAGGLLPDDQKYFNELKQKSMRAAIELYPNITHEKLSKLYAASRFYWHAAGYREQRPEHMEHFGISTVEAMSAGAIPFVYAAGGLPEIIRQGQDGYLWADIDDLIDKTRELMNNPKAQKSISSSAKKRAREFSPQKFEDAFDELLIKLW